MQTYGYQPSVIREGSSLRMVVHPVYIRPLGKTMLPTTPRNAARVLKVESLLKPEDGEEGYRSLANAWKCGAEQVKSAISKFKDDHTQREMRRSLAANIYASLQSQIADLLVAVSKMDTDLDRFHATDAGTRISKCFADLHKFSLWGTILEWLARSDAALKGTKEILGWLSTEIEYDSSGPYAPARLGDMRTVLSSNQRTLDYFSRITSKRLEKGLGGLIDYVEAKHGANPAFRAQVEDSIGKLSLTEWTGLFECMNEIVKATNEGSLSTAVLSDLRKLDAVGIQDAIRDWDAYQDKVMFPPSEQTVTEGTAGRSRAQKKKAKKASANRTKSNKESLATHHGWIAAQRAWVNTKPQAFVDLSDEFSGLMSENVFSALKNENSSG